MDKTTKTDDTAGNLAAMRSGRWQWVNIIFGVVGEDYLPWHEFIVIVVKVIIPGGFLFGAQEFVEHGYSSALCYDHVPSLNYLNNMLKWLIITLHSDLSMVHLLYFSIILLIRTVYI